MDRNSQGKKKTWKDGVSWQEAELHDYTGVVG